MINLLQYYSKTEYKFCKQTSFCNVPTNNTSSGPRENVIITNFGAKYGREIWHQYEHGEGADILEDHTYQGDIQVPPRGGDPSGNVIGMWKREASL